MNDSSKKTAVRMEEAIWVEARNSDATPTKRAQKCVTAGANIGADGAAN